MIPSVLTGAAVQNDRRFKGLVHPDYPIEQTVRGRDSNTHMLMVRSARRLRNVADARYLEASRGVRVLGRSEQALDHATAQLVGRHAERVTVEPPCIRYVYGAQVLEPWMDILVNVPQRYGCLIEQDFNSRRAILRRLERQGSATVLEGEAPLAGLLGYADWLRELTQADPNVAMWLSRYLPLDRGPQVAPSP